MIGSIFLFFSSISYGYSQIIDPSPIILEPLGCVKITLTLLKPAQYISIKLYTRDQQVVAVFEDHESSPFEDMSLYYHHFLYDMGSNWILLCDVDYMIESHIICFLANYGNTTERYCSDPIILANCEFTKDCITIFLPKPNTPLPPIFFLDEHIGSQFIVGMTFPEDLTIVKLSLCNHNLYCEHHLAISDEIIAIWEDNLVVLEVPSKAFHFQVQNHRLSEVTAHILCEKGHKYKLITTQFKFRDLLESKFEGFNIELNIKNNLHMIFYEVFFKDDTMPNLHRVIVAEDKYPLEVKIGKFTLNGPLKFHVWDHAQIYWIIFLQIQLSDTMGVFFYTHYFKLKNIEDEENSTIQPQNTTRSTSSTIVITPKRSSKYRVALISGISVISFLAILIISLMIYMYKTYWVISTDPKPKAIYELNTGEVKRYSAPKKN